MSRSRSRTRASPCVVHRSPNDFMNENTKANNSSTEPTVTWSPTEISFGGRTLKVGTRYLHPIYREVIFISAFWSKPSGFFKCYVARNSGERLDVPAQEVGGESTNQGKECIECGVFTEPLRFHPHRRKCRRCVRREDRIRKGGRWEDMQDMTDRAVFVINRVFAAITKDPTCQEKILAAETHIEANQVIDDVLGRTAA